MLRNVSHPTVLSIVAMEMFLLMTNADAQPNRPMNTVPVLRYEPPASFMRSAVYPPEDYLSTHCCKAGSTRGIGKRVWQADRNLGSVDPRSGGCILCDLYRRQSGYSAAAHADTDCRGRGNGDRGCIDN